MKTSTPDIREWILSGIAGGHSPEKLLEQMVGVGWDEDRALEMLERVLREKAEEIAARASSVPLPEPHLTESPTAIRALDRDVRVTLAIAKPRIVVFENLLSPEECEGLIEESRSRLETSRVVGKEFGKNELHHARVSEGMFFTLGESTLIQRIEARIAALLHWPVDHGEAIQILRYGRGGKYDPHYDYFNPSNEGTAAATRQGGQRVGTLIMYLRTPSKGGGTVFPAIGLEVMPQQGSGVFFSYAKPDPSTQTLHGGMPVIEGEKWIATKWLRERKFH
jgi:prolyl 4-hydroxylase